MSEPIRAATDWGEKGKLSGKPLMPQFGGTGVWLNQRLALARSEKDSEAEIEVNVMRRKLFRGSRSDQENIDRTAELKRRFIQKYGKAGQLAIAKDELRAKLKAMTQEELLEYNMGLKRQSIEAAASMKKEEK